jgi:hypothetical protein
METEKGKHSISVNSLRRLGIPRCSTGVCRSQYLLNMPLTAKSRVFPYYSCDTVILTKASSGNPERDEPRCRAARQSLTRLGRPWLCLNSKRRNPLPGTVEQLPADDSRPYLELSSLPQLSAYQDTRLTPQNQFSP